MRLVPDRRARGPCSPRPPRGNRVPEARLGMRPPAQTRGCPEPAGAAAPHPPLSAARWTSPSGVWRRGRRPGPGALLGPRLPSFSVPRLQEHTGGPWPCRPLWGARQARGPTRRGELGLWVRSPTQAASETLGPRQKHVRLCPVEISLIIWFPPSYLQQKNSYIRQGNGTKPP